MIMTLSSVCCSPSTIMYSFILLGKFAILILSLQAEPATSSLQSQDKNQVLWIDHGEAALRLGNLTVLTTMNIIGLWYIGFH